ncbi:hypothetical protein ACQ4PT_054253 [Festuca glaucescens]
MEGDELTNQSTEIRKIVAHGTTEIEVVYTDDSYEASKTVDMYEQWLSKDEYKFMGLDFEYCNPEYEDDCRIAVVQLTMKNHVLVYQWSSSDPWCPKLMDFLRSGVHFASVDIRNDKKAMKESWNIEIPGECHIDLQDLFKLERDRTGMADMAAALIDKTYKGMKKEFPSSQHKFWEKKPLDKINLEYAARDGFVAYELYRIIRLCNYGQRHLLPPQATPTAVQPSSTSGRKASASSSRKGKELTRTKRSRGDEGWTYMRITDGHEKWSDAAWGFLTYDQTSPIRFPGVPWDKWSEEKKTKKAYYFLGVLKRDIVDGLTATEGTDINWKEMGKLIAEVDKLDMFVEENDAGDFYFLRSYGLVHTLNWSNTTKNFMKLPRRIVPEDMDEEGAITLVCHPNMRLSSTYTISHDNQDKRVCVNKWDKFMKMEPTLKMGHKVLMILHLGDHGIYLFVSYMPDVPLDE